MNNLVESLLATDHESLAELLIESNSALKESNAGRALEMLDLFWARLAVHIRAENLHLFPAIATSDRSLFTGKGNLPTSGEAHKILLQLRTDHNFFMTELAAAIKTMRMVIAGDSPKEQSLASIGNRLALIRQRLEDHNRIEEEQAYKWPELALSQSEQQALRERLKRELENLPPRFVDSLEQ